MLFLNYLLLADEHLHHYHKFDQEYTPIPSVFEYHGFGNFMAKMMTMNEMQSKIEQKSLLEMKSIDPFEDLVRYSTSLSN